MITNLKKYVTPLLTLARGAVSVPLLMSMSEAFSVPFDTLIKLCYTKALERSSLVPGPEAKSSLEITNPTWFTVKLSGGRVLPSIVQVLDNAIYIH